MCVNVALVINDLSFSFQMEDMTATASVIGTEIIKLSSPLYKCPDPEVL